MNSKEHLYISLSKSVIRIIACIDSIVKKNMLPMIFGFLIAETLGITEELVDKRV